MPGRAMREMQRRQRCRHNTCGPRHWGSRRASRRLTWTPCHSLGAGSFAAGVCAGAGAAVGLEALAALDLMELDATVVVAAAGAEGFCGAAADCVKGAEGDCGKAA